MPSLKRLSEARTVSAVTSSPSICARGLGNDAKAIDAGVGHTCALTARGGVKCWGSNFAGQLGDGTTNGHTPPRYVVGLHRGATSIAVGNWHTCALTTGGGVKCWGMGEESQVGIGGTSPQRSTPVDVVGFGPQAGDAAH